MHRAGRHNKTRIRIRQLRFDLRSHLHRLYSIIIGKTREYEYLQVLIIQGDKKILLIITYLFCK
jgi:hypothetical protein